MSEHDTIVGRRRIAHELGRAPWTVTRWVKTGVLPAVKSGPFKNSVLEVRAVDLERLRHVPQDRDGMT